MQYNICLHRNSLQEHPKTDLLPDGNGCNHKFVKKEPWASGMRTGKSIRTQSGLTAAERHWYSRQEAVRERLLLNDILPADQTACQTESEQSLNHSGNGTVFYSVQAESSSQSVNGYALTGLSNQKLSLIHI